MKQRGNCKKYRSKRFFKLRIVQLHAVFRGEPTLNMPAVRAFVDETMCMVNQGIIPRPPDFGMVTNGAFDMHLKWWLSARNTTSLRQSASMVLRISMML